MRRLLIRPEEKGTSKFYALGFILCIVLTLAAYFLVTEKLLKGWILISTILGIGVIQMAVQLIFFMHLGSEYATGKAKHHWNMLVFFFMLMVQSSVKIVSCGSPGDASPRARRRVLRSSESPSPSRANSQR